MRLTSIEDSSSSTMMMCRTSELGRIARLRKVAAYKPVVLKDSLTQADYSRFVFQGSLKPIKFYRFEAFEKFV